MSRGTIRRMALMTSKTTPPRRRIPSAEMCEAWSAMRLARTILYCQGVYYVMTGVWPLINMLTFEYVTGPKSDAWLVKTVGLLALVIGTVILFGLREAKIPAEVPLLAGLAAVAFLVVDVVYAMNGTISAIYFADA